MGFMCASAMGVKRADYLHEFLNSLDGNIGVDDVHNLARKPAQPVQPSLIAPLNEGFE